MNKKSILFKSIALATVFTLNVSLYVELNKKAAVVEASSYSVNSVPTTIDLNDTSEPNIRSYYSSLNSLTANERKGTNLLKNLKPILKNGQKYFSYGSSATKAVWQAYEIVDRDWNKSPASSISGYNAQTKIITGYVYGISNSDVGTNPYIHALYVNRDVNNQTRAWGNHEQDQWGINQEHVWAKSCGFENESPAAGARGDLMHLWAGNGRVNGNTHSNYYYGYVDQTKTYNDAGSYASTLSGNLRGTSKTLGGSVTVFEPQDSDKGDIARAIFYMAARYNYLSGSDSDGIDAGNPNLEIVNNVTSWQNSGYQSSTSTTGKMGILQDLLEWNRLDPPDQWEIHRNNILYNNFTNNRNPFIDFPSWADAIWGVSENGSYNSTPTKSASPTNDPINTFVANSFAVSESSLELEVGDTAEISGSNATSNITWSVDDNTVISLNKNSTANNEAVTITALKAGSATITASSGGNNAVCTVTVTEEQQTGDLELASSIFVGDTVYLTCNAASTQYNGPSGIGTSAIGTHASFTTAPDADAYPLDVCSGSETDTYAFKIKSGSYANKYLAWHDGNTLYASDTLNSNSSWTVSIDGSKNATIANANTPARVIWWNVNSPRFCCYTGKTDGASFKYVQLWKATNVDPVPTVDDYLENTEKYFVLEGNEGTQENTNTINYPFSGSGLANAADVDNLSLGGGITLDGDIGTNNRDVPKYYTSGTSMRVYVGNTFTFTCTKNIVSIAFSFSQGNETGLSASTGEFDENVWEGSATEITFTNTSSGQVRISSLSVTTSEEALVVNNVLMRFGATIPSSDWNYINDTWGISDYGVMMAKETTLAGYGVSSIKQAYKNHEYLSDFHRGSNVMPHPEAETYKFTAKVTMTDEANYGIVFCAAPYIVIDGEYYFLEEIRYSVNTLADYYLEHGGSSLSEDALNLLAGN